MVKLTEQETIDLTDHAKAVIARLPATRKVERFDWCGRTSRAVRIFGGFQVQSADHLKLIAERKHQPA